MIWCMEEDSAKHLGALSLRNAARRQSANQNNLVESFDSLSRRDDNTLMRLTHLGSGVKRNFTAEKIDYFSWLPVELHEKIIKSLMPDNLTDKNAMQQISALEQEKKFDKADQLKKQFIAEQAEKLIDALQALTALAQVNRSSNEMVQSDAIKRAFFCAIPSNEVLNSMYAKLQKNHCDIEEEKKKNPNTSLRFSILKSFQQGINELHNQVKIHDGRILLIKKVEYCTNSLL